MKLAPFNVALIASLASIFAWSAYRPFDTFTWFLEVVPVLAGSVAIALTYKRFPLTRLLYGLLWLHAIVLIVGGKYTYALNPGFEWLKSAWGLERNYYDRLGHLMQGLVPALVVREVLLRTSALRPGMWTFFLVLCVAQAISAWYEFIEWWVAAGTGEAAEAFLGTQGDVWDTQWDMFCAFCGAIFGQLAFSRWQDRQIAALPMPRA
ncbi:MAG: DUF2238 domain-containing protein [Myxococcota bacterium]|jgi:putative membrane protein|nr:DUF2238 domain-containing protein [Myxococcota bacterium]